MKDHLHLSHPLLYQQWYHLFLLCNCLQLLQTNSSTHNSSSSYASIKLVLFKPEFAGKPDEDVEAHLLRSNDWMDTHAFPEGVKVQQFCLTLVGEAGLWYKSLRPIALDWNGLQNQFSQQYSKIGNTREQLFHASRSFHFDENTETLDTYVTNIRQVATLLGFGKPQVLEVFKNTLPTRL